MKNLYSRMRFSTALTLLFALTSLSNGQSHWSYNEVGNWKDTYPACGGNMQSPININTDDTKAINNCNDLQYKYFDDYFSSVTLQNDGHTAKITLNQKSRIPKITGGPIFSPYEFSAMHLHWGRNDNEGSEHKIDGKTYVMEIHMVFTNPVYGADALQYRDGAVVLATLLKVGSENRNIQTIVKHLGSITNTNATTTIYNFPPLRHFLPYDLDDYATYLGSLTTPPCDQSVQFIVYLDQPSVASSQVNAFRQLRDSEGNKITYNFRPIQPLNNRIVFEHFDFYLH